MFYVILEYTAVGGLINGFINFTLVRSLSLQSAFYFGTWLKENKNIDFFVRGRMKKKQRTNAARAVSLRCVYVYK
jgi:hypothetical protein